MNRTAVSIVVITLALLTSACGTVPLGPVGLQGENVLAAVRDLTKTYERRDLDAFMEKVSTAYPGREAFRTSVEKVFATYQTISFKLHYTKMLIVIQEKGNIKATFTWEGEWKTSGGKIVKDGARVTLVLDPGAYRLLGIEGKNLYLPSETPMPVRE
jgi:hypothetical protein